MAGGDERQAGGRPGRAYQDRDASNTYMQIVQFPSFEQAMANSSLPEISEFAAKLASLCDGHQPSANSRCSVKSRCSERVVTFCGVSD
jgi:hypothetical protein